jgi:hypothetical protein
VPSNSTKKWHPKFMQSCILELMNTEQVWSYWKIQQWNDIELIGKVGQGMDTRKLDNEVLSIYIYIYIYIIIIIILQYYLLSIYFHTLFYIPRFNFPRFIYHPTPLSNFIHFPSSLKGDWWPSFPQEFSNVLFPPFWRNSFSSSKEVHQTIIQYFIGDIQQVGI